MMKSLFLNPPSFEGFDGAAGARYQAKREIRSFWYPTWLAQPAALVPDSTLVDAPARGLSLEEVGPMARSYQLAVLYTSTPSFRHDVAVADRLKQENPGLLVGLVGAHAAVLPEVCLKASGSIDFVARNEFDFTIREIAQGKPLRDVEGLSYREGNRVVHNLDRAVLHDMDQLPFVIDVYRRDLVIEDYFIGYLRHPYLSVYTGRGCKSRCTFCLWPQTIGGHVYRTRSVGHVLEEMGLAKRYFPQVKEFFFDDDTLTDDLPRVEALARGMGRLGLTWSCNAKANVPRETLKILKDNGARLFVVGFESGNQQILNNIKKGTHIRRIKQFAEDCHDLGLTMHGTFIVGLPGETHETIEETIEFAKEVNPHTLQVSLAATYPGTYLYDQAKANGWLREANQSELVAGDGLQVSALTYPHLSDKDIFEAVSTFYRRFYFRPSKIAAMAAEMLTNKEMLARRLREGGEFYRFLLRRKNEAIEFNTAAMQHVSAGGA